MSGKCSAKMIFAKLQIQSNVIKYGICAIFTSISTISQIHFFVQCAMPASASVLKHKPKTVHERRDCLHKSRNARKISNMEKGQQYSNFLLYGTYENGNILFSEE